ncbi:MAG: molybdate ABC transporter substrate-binding protein [Actinomycetota bacterium]|nr:molybdate ABC transporter substrate-binding protein [Actinomycetota bacterium]
MNKPVALITLASLAMTAALGLNASHTAASPSSSAPPSGSITVSAAASLTDVFPMIATAFMKRYPGTSVKFNFAGSSTLVQQVIAGAPVDVLATASEPTMSKAVKVGFVGRPLLFAKNSMAIAMPAGNPAKISTLSSLNRSGLLVAVCAVSVPCGTAARDLLMRNSVSVRPVTLELDVRAVLAKVIAGEVDAGIVYVTDVKSVGSKVSSIAIPSELNVTTTYSIATVNESGNSTAAQAFVDYVRFTTSAQGIMRAYGFAKPW